MASIQGTGLPYNPNMTYPSLGGKGVSVLDTAKSQGKGGISSGTVWKVGVAIAIGLLVLLIVYNATKKNEVVQNCFTKKDKKDCPKSLMGAGKDIVKGVAPVVGACSTGLTPHCAATVAGKFFDEGSQFFKQANYNHY